MFKKFKFKKVLMITLVLVLVLSTVVVAANNVYKKEITATLGIMKFEVDGKDVTKEIEKKYDSPAFVVEERSYVPVRAIADLMGLEIVYDNSTHTAKIIDLKDAKHKKEIIEKDTEIAKLEKQIKELKKDVVVESDLKTLETKINKDYGSYKNVSFDIYLKETSNKNVSVDIEVDFRYSTDQNYWNRMNSNDKKSMIEGITDMISKEFPNADITGRIYDHYDNKDLLTFSKARNRNVSITYGGRGTSSGSATRYIEDRVKREFNSKFIFDAEVAYFNLGSSNIDMEIKFTDKYKYAWNKIKDEKDARDMLDKISDEIMDEYYYDYYDGDRISIDVYMDRDIVGYYDIEFGDKTGRFRFY